MATNFSPCKGSYVLNQFPSNVMFGMNVFHVSASGAIQGHHGPLVFTFQENIRMQSVLYVEKLDIYRNSVLIIQEACILEVAAVMSVVL